MAYGTAVCASTGHASNAAPDKFTLFDTGFIFKARLAQNDSWPPMHITVPV